MRKYKITICLFLLCSIAFAQENAEDWMPDSSLRHQIRVHLKLPDNVPLTKTEIKRLTLFDDRHGNIRDITGLEHATYLEHLDLESCEILDLKPFEKLASLEHLRVLKLDKNDPKLTDITPLSSLTQLTYLDLGKNEISDITPLANLIQLQHLDLRNNYISDITPLANLIQLEALILTNNILLDFTPVENLPLQTFEHDWICDVPMQDVASRLEKRTFPSIVHAWHIRREEYGLEHSKVGLFFGPYWYKLDKIIGTDIIRFQEGSEEYVMSHYERFRKKNPDALHLIGMIYREAWHTQFPEDSPYWLRGEDGERLRSVLGDKNLSYYIDFTKPETINFIVQQAIAVAKCGLFDGIVFDWWTDYHAILKDRSRGRILVHGVEVEQNARDEILRRIRAEVPEDFIIIGNGNRAKNMRTAWACNGSTMELGQDYPGGYTHAGLVEIDDALFWISENMREPRVNAVHFSGIEYEAWDSPNNRQMMRVCSSLVLTMSNAFFSYRPNNQREYHWYEFWDADLGRPISGKAELYDSNIEGLFIREFTNGWVVYNRSYADRTIRFSVPVQGTHSKRIGTEHEVPDIDGEIFIKVDIDLNDDGAVNILDLVIIANAFGEDAPDINGDGVVNILDLVIVANAFGEE